MRPAIGPLTLGISQLMQWECTSSKIWNLRNQPWIAIVQQRGKQRWVSGLYWSQWSYYRTIVATNLLQTAGPKEDWHTLWIVSSIQCFSLRVWFPTENLPICLVILEANRSTCSGPQRELILRKIAGFRCQSCLLTTNLDSRSALLFNTPGIWDATS